MKKLNLSQEQKEAASNIFNELVEKALNEEYTKRDLIRNYADFRYLKKYIHTEEQAIKKFNAIAVDILHQYIALLETDSDTPEDVSFLASYSQMKDCARFYKEDADRLKYYIAEWMEYASTRNKLKILFGEERPEELLYDFLQTKNND